ncbi:Hsp20 family protein [Neokomagataea thailandica]|uniref:Heat shock protein Hsp20 n=1 Tax=Neokomagataea tanensis NBRC 106556 TaxID=1223519 RepID=A0ABQ0QK53_9PROT|nr:MULTISPECIES: Hsp20 family protein [Neokomagataea]GBR47706.1 heat shock protein Hsp20 [Neokomagataea tanensis NBRC 106556]
MALAGFDAQNVHVIHENGALIIRGRAVEHERARKLLHRGIATRPFEKRFALADYSEVTQASFVNGVLSVIVKNIVPDERCAKVIPVMTEQKCEGAALS